MKFRCTAMVLALLAAVGFAAAAAGDVEKDKFYMKDDALMRRDKPFRLAAIETPGIATPGTSDEDIAIALRQVSEVGANTVCFDLDELDIESGKLSKETRETLDRLIEAYVYRRMGAICRISGAMLGADEHERLKNVGAVAKALKKERRIVYWIDGPDAGKLAAKFHRKARKLVVIAPEGGHITAVPKAPADTENREFLLVGKMPRSISADLHFVLPDKPENYATLDKANEDPAEKEPWEPDNSVLTEQERAEGWIALFDGKTLDGWIITGEQDGFRVKDGAIEWAKRGGETIRTRDRYGNFILRIEWKIEKDGNSGIFLRAPRANRSSKIGMEFQLQGDHGKEPTKTSTGSIYSVVAPAKDATKPDDEWNTLEITLDGPKLKAVLNGEVIQDLNLDDDDELKVRLRRGFIGLQDHGRHVAFRNIRLKKL